LPNAIKQKNLREHEAGRESGAGNRSSTVNMDNPMYNAILKWSLAQIDTSDPNRPAPPPMDPEKQAFLDKVRERDAPRKRNANA
jgi:hypothetical protein